MSKGGPEPFERGRAAGDPGPDVDDEALRARLFGDAVGALKLYTIYLGERLGCIGTRGGRRGRLGAAGRSRRNRRTVRAGVA